LSATELLILSEDSGRLRSATLKKPLIARLRERNKKGPGEEPFFPLVSKREENSFEFSTLMKRCSVFMPPTLMRREHRMKFL